MTMNYYQQKREQYGDDVRALGWGSVESQQLRFQVLSEVADLRCEAVLDYGCGFGDLYAFLGLGVDYIGYEPDPEMLARARAKYPRARFVAAPLPADYVLESGAFNLESDWQTELRELWEKFCRKGMALNFTSALAERQTPGIVYADPFATARFCSGLTKRFILRHDYKSNDFTVYLYKESGKA